jgi:4,5-dihydroxyphthalate decarboxylase
MTAAPTTTLDKTTLKVAFDDYPQTRAFKSGEVKSERLAFDFSDIKPANKFFKPMVRELRFDISEMALGTFLQAKAYGKPLVLLPATIVGRFQHGAMLCNTARPLKPSDLPGKRVGVRAYSQTTGAWIRGILQNDYGVDMDKVHWITFEDGHVAEVPDPPGVERAAPGKVILQMLRDGELDAAILGVDLPSDPAFQSVIPDPDEAAKQWYAKHKTVHINHMVVVTEKLAQSNPEAVREVFRLLKASKQAAGLPKPGSLDMLPYGFEACRPALATMIRYQEQQRLLPRPLTVDELFNADTRSLA